MLSFPDNCPRIYSTVMRDGELVNGLGKANTLGVTWVGEPYIDRVRYQDLDINKLDGRR